MIKIFAFVAATLVLGAILAPWLYQLGKGMAEFFAGKDGNGPIQFVAKAAHCAYKAVSAVVEKIRQETRVIFVDFHAEATSEKVAMGWHLDGKVSAVVGTHTHVQTADESVFPGGTGYLTDAGMCGPEESILGRSIESVVWRFKSGMPTRFPIAKGPVRLCGPAQLEATRWLSSCCSSICRTCF